MLALGNFLLGGFSSSSSRRVVICVPNDHSKVSSFIPLSFMKVVETANEEVVVGVKRKSDDKGPGKKNYSSLKSATAVSHSLTRELINTVEKFLKVNKNENKLKMIV